MVKKLKKETIDKINKTINEYEKELSKLEKVDDEIFNKFYIKFPYGKYNPIKRLFSGKEKVELKQERLKIIHKLTELRSEIIKFEEEYKIGVGETLYMCFKKICTGENSGSRWSRSYGDLGYLVVDNMYFPEILHNVGYYIFKGKKIKTSFNYLNNDVDEEIQKIIYNSERMRNQYGLNGYSISIDELDNY